ISAIRKVRTSLARGRCSPTITTFLVRRPSVLLGRRRTASHSATPSTISDNMSRPTPAAGSVSSATIGRLQPGWSAQILLTHPHESTGCRLEATEAELSCGSRSKHRIVRSRLVVILAEDGLTSRGRYGQGLVHPAVAAESLEQPRTIHPSTAQVEILHPVDDSDPAVPDEFHRATASGAPDGFPGATRHLAQERIEPVERPRVRREHVHDHVEEVEQDPVALPLAVDVPRKNAVALQRLADLARDRLCLPRVAA